MIRDLKVQEKFRKVLKQQDFKDLQLEALKLHGLCVFLDVPALYNSELEHIYILYLHNPYTLAHTYIKFSFNEDIFTLIMQLKYIKEYIF